MDLLMIVKQLRLVRAMSNEKYTKDQMRNIINHPELEHFDQETPNNQP